ncbi:uncharacterized protein LOC131939403 [Physella acuta]|uniref:uncharacterized protein LOC131939403 n=1 Tax=Physella acuta TaxID=109671 RepID=UPI0027DBBDFF|nr:uncharacterized protein LOC131939403 [Physella acuta]
MVIYCFSVLGRNVALKQNVKQSSSLPGQPGAEAVVDGIADTCGRVLTPTNDPNHSFEIQFNKTMTITGITLYNRGGGLKGFELAIFDSSSNRLFNYKENSEVQIIYGLNVQLLKGVSKIEIKQKEEPKAKDTIPILSVCELEAFGDCDDGFWGLDCQKCSGLCTKACHKETGKCEDKTSFGEKNQYDCHCENRKCELDGQCKPGFKCKLGWFGNRCQYVDILGSYKNNHILTDGNDDTCLDTTVKNVTLCLGNIYTPSFIRLVYKKDNKTRPGLNPFLGCSTVVYDVRENIRDYFCETQVKADVVKISDEDTRDLCSVYFSGGRNLALNQIAVLSSTHANFKASLAVDGDKKQCERSFTQTSDQDKTPSFKVTFDKPVSVSRVKLYNKVDAKNKVVELSDRLKGFVLETIDSNNKQEQVYIDKGPTQAVYSIDFGKIKTVSAIQVKQTSPPISVDKTPILMICEIEVFGDCPDGFWGLECQQQCDSGCSKPCHKETGQCFRKDCSNGKWGLDCQKQCDNGCSNGCDTETGTCTIKACPHGFWGPTCQKKCDSLCSKPCDLETGQCYRKECAPGRWGLDCQAKCDESCANPCHLETGECERKSSNNDTIDKYGLIEHIQTYTWVGPKKRYRCNCRGDHCYINGTCWPAEKCSLGWFGKYCQYVDLLANHDSSNILTDGDDHSCTKVLSNSLTLELGGEFPVTLVRLATRAELGTGKAIEMEFQGKTKRFKCPDAKVYTQNNIKDIFCGGNELATALILKGPGLLTLCSVYFSGGRNFAIKQKIVQKPNSKNTMDKVDGNLWNCDYDDPPLEENKEAPSIEIQFDKTISVNHFRLFSRIFG